MRTVLNMTPPIFGAKTFKEYASDCPKSLKDNLAYLEEGLRKLADLYAHQLISKKTIRVSEAQIEPYKPQFELLLQQVVNSAHCLT